MSPGSTISEPKNLFSTNGKLQVNVAYRTRVDQFGNTLYCFVTDNGDQSPTLHVHPGDELILHLKNELPPSSYPAAMPEMTMTTWHPGDCGNKPMNTSSVNLHYHGTNVAPACHQDEVLTTVVNQGIATTTMSIFPRTNRRDFTGITPTSTGSRSPRCWAAPPAPSSWKAWRT